jgi:hypothetical protein
MRVDKKLNIVISKLEQETRGEDTLQVNIVYDGKSKEKKHITTNETSLTEEEKVIVTKFFMVMERLLNSNNANNSIGI